MSFTQKPPDDIHCKLIFSRNNIHIRRLRSLQSREGRARTGLFFIDGIRHVAQAVQVEAKIETLLIAPKMLDNLFGQKLVKRLRLAGTPCYSVTPEVYHSLSQAEEPQGLGAVVRQRWERLEKIDPRAGLCWTAAESVRSPGNLGTIIRTSAAVGGAGLLLIGDTTDPYDPATVRATMGALFAQQFVRATSQEIAAWKLRQGCTFVGTSPFAAKDYQAVRYERPVVLVMGSEKRGMSEELQALCDVIVKIPMEAATDSLNVAVATGVMLYELFNQRRAAS